VEKERREGKGGGCKERIEGNGDPVQDNVG
jgi:hypothetical protein